MRKIGRATIVICTFLVGVANADRKEQESDARYLAKSLNVWVDVDGHLQLNNDYNKTSCVEHLKALSDAGAPDSVTFVQEHDIPDLKAGTHPWADGRAACTTIINAVARGEKISTFVHWVKICKEEQSRGLHHEDVLKNCIETYEAAVKAGIPPTESVDGNTMKELYENVCVAGKKEADAIKGAAEGPYRKVLKSDKLKIWLRDTTYISLPGVRELTPQALAAAKVWFEEATPEKSCSNGLAVHTLYRYQFDGQHKLVKDSVHTYCGHPPDSAWR